MLNYPYKKNIFAKIYNGFNGNKNLDIQDLISEDSEKQE